MGFRLTRKSGDLLNLAHKLSDGATDKAVIATVKDIDGNNIYQPIRLTHIGSGAYIDETLAMTSDQILIVNYEVFETDEVTPAGYTRDFDIYELEDSSKALKDIGINRINVIEAQFNLTKNIDARIKELSIRTKVKSSDLVVTIEKTNEIETNLMDNNINGEVQ